MSNKMNKIEFLSSRVDYTQSRIKTLEVKRKTLRKKRKKIYLPLSSLVIATLCVIGTLNLGVLLWVMLVEAVLFIKFETLKEDLKIEEGNVLSEIQALKKQLVIDENDLDNLIIARKKQEALQTVTDKNAKRQLSRLKAEVELLKDQKERLRTQFTQSEKEQKDNFTLVKKMEK